MVIGIGVDIVEVQRIERALGGSGSMVTRVFTPAEIEYCEQRQNRAQHFAGRFAAKEAALKALGTGWGEGIRWRDVEVTAEDSGRPILHLHGRARQVSEDRGAKRSLVTITHAEAYAVALVVIEGD